MMRPHNEENLQKDLLDYQAFLVICLICVSIGVFGLVVDYMVQTTPIDLTLDAFGLVFFISVFVFVRIKQDHRSAIYPTLFFIFLASPAYWLQIGHINVIGTVLYLGALVMAIFIAPVEIRKLTLVAFYVLGFIYVFGDILVDFKAGQIDFNIYSSYVYFLPITFGIGYATYYLKSNFDLERKRIRIFGQSLHELYQSSISDNQPLDDVFFNSLSMGCKLLNTEKAFITKWESNKWRVVKMTGFDLNADLDGFSEAYNEKSFECDLAFVIPDIDLRLLGETIRAMIIAPIYFGGVFYGHLVFLWPFPNRHLMKYDIELAEVISQNLGYLINADNSKGEERKTREALSLSENRFRNIFENANVGIAVADLNGSFIMANPAYRTMVGYTQEELMRMSFLDVSHPDDLDLEKDKYKNLIEGRVNDYQVEKRNIRKDGSLITVLITVSLIHDSNNKACYGIGIIEDITQRKKHEQEIKQLNNDLAQSIRRLKSTNAELESFSYSVSHDLRAPLRAINGFSKILEEDYGTQIDDEGKRLINIVANNAAKMGGLIDDLLSFSKLSRKLNDMEEVCLNDLLRGIVNDLAVEYKTDGVIEIENPLPSVYADKSLLRQALINVITNALKFSSNQEQPRVLIQGKGEKGKTRVSITDNGVGFDMKYQNKLFKVFQRLHSSEEFTGTGVGLAIVERIIKRHEGRVWAEGSLGKGATFHLELPGEIKVDYLPK